MWSMGLGLQSGEAGKFRVAFLDNGAMAVTSFDQELSTTCARATPRPWSIKLAKLLFSVFAKMGVASGRRTKHPRVPHTYHVMSPTCQPPVRLRVCVGF